jgi:hypothetical protein
MLNGLMSSCWSTAVSEHNQRSTATSMDVTVETANARRTSHAIAALTVNTFVKILSYLCDP